MKLTLLLIPLILLSSCTIDWNDEKDTKIAELGRKIEVLEIENKALNKEKQSLLIGSYFTPHAATRRIEFFMNGNFSFQEDEGKTSKGQYDLIGGKLLLMYESGKNTKLRFYKGNDKDNNFYLEGDGEYFVKE